MPGIVAHQLLSNPTWVSLSARDEDAHELLVAPTELKSKDPSSPFLRPWITMVVILVAAILYGASPFRPRHSETYISNMAMSVANKQTSVNRVSPLVASIPPTVPGSIALRKHHGNHRTAQIRSQGNTVLMQSETTANGLRGAVGRNGVPAVEIPKYGRKPQEPASSSKTPEMHKIDAPLVHQPDLGIWSWVFALSLAGAVLTLVGRMQVVGAKEMGQPQSLKDDRENGPVRLAMMANDGTEEEEEEKCMRRFARALMKTKPLPCPPSPEEQTLFKFLLDVNAKYNLQTELRVAGGWVRDRLMGGESADVDIALAGPAPPGNTDPEMDYITGEKFAHYISQYMAESGEKCSYGVVKANPGQSKHLETATAHVKGFEIDLVHLRKEDYAADSRIPTITRATPVEDAYRRDLTINALFYNLHTQLAEDFTEKGFDDLEGKYIRTPLPPLETFRDDPLRLLRCIRFACKLDFAMDPEIIKCGQEVKKDLEEKVSRERVGIEIGKMFEGPQPHKAVYYLKQSGIRDVVFNSQEVNSKGKNKGPSGPPKPLPWEESTWSQTQSLMDQLVTHEVYTSDQGTHRQVIMFAALLHAIHPTPADRSAPFPVQTEPIHTWLDAITTHSLKVPGKIATLTSHMLLASTCVLPIMEEAWANVVVKEEAQLQEALTEWLAPERGISSGRVKIGEWLRFITPSLWRGALALACYTSTSLPVPGSPSASYDILSKCIVNSQLPETAECKPLVKGNQLLEVLELPKGPAVSIATQYLIKLQLAYPTDDASKLLDRLRAYKEEIEATAPAPKKR